MAISKEAFEDLNRSFEEEVKKIKEQEERIRRESFSSKKFVDAPSLADDRAKVHEDLLKEQRRKVAERVQKLEGQMFQDFGGSRSAAMKHFVPAFEQPSGKVSEEFNKQNETTPEKTREEKRAEFYNKTINEFNDKGQEISRDKGHGLERD